jgi:hypothetical protein
LTSNLFDDTKAKEKLEKRVGKERRALKNSKREKRTKTKRKVQWEFYRGERDVLFLEYIKAGKRGIVFKRQSSSLLTAKCM